MNEQQATLALDSANVWLSKHPEYESWMRFTGIKEEPRGVYHPRCELNPPEESQLSKVRAREIYSEIWSQTLIQK